MLIILFKSHLIRQSGTGRAFKDTQRTLEHLRHLDTRALRAVNHLGTWALGHLRHSGTWVLRALRNLGTSALKALEHSSTWALEALYLADSLLYNLWNAVELL